LSYKYEGVSNPFMDPKSLVILLSFIFSSAYAGESKFSSTEFSYDLKNIGVKRSDSSKEIIAKVEKRLKGFKVKGEQKKYAVYYIDTEDRELKQNNLIFRIRPNLTQPKKSTFTIKVRSAFEADLMVLDAQNFDEVKFEIDRKGSGKSYSVSYVVKSNFMKEIEKVKKNAFLDFLRKNYPVIFQILSKNTDPDSLGIPKKVIRKKYSLKYRAGGIPALEDTEFDFEVWFFKQKTLSSLSFKVNTSDVHHFTKAYSDLEKKLSKRKLFQKKIISKTETYWKD
jgi:hypothetical protein